MTLPRSSALIARIRRLARDRGICDFRALAEAALELADEHEIAVAANLRLEAVIHEGAKGGGG
jgi:hypothetical protein